MSGSNSSAPPVAADVAGEALSLTVHSMPAPDLDARRTRSGRIKMLLVLLVCAAPVIASYLTYFVIRPEGRTNYSTLIQPTRSMPDLSLREVDGRPVTPSSLHGQWLLLVVGPASCGPACEKRLLVQRQVREMLGRDSDRVDKLWLVTDGGRPAPALAVAVGSLPGFRLLHADAAKVATWLEAEAGQTIEDHLYLVDPMGEWMMRVPADPDPGRLKRDLDKLLRASSSWDRAGR